MMLKNESPSVRYHALNALCHYDARVVKGGNLPWLSLNGIISSYILKYQEETHLGSPE